MNSNYFIKVAILEKAFLSFNNVFKRFRKVQLIGFFFLVSPLIHFSQSNIAGVSAGGDIFGTRVFIENKGQFDTCVPRGYKVYFALEDGEEKVYITDKGLVILQQEHKPFTHEEIERMEHGKSVKSKDGPKYYIFQTFPGVKNLAEPEALEKQSHYFTYGERALNSFTYKKVRFPNVYPGIDLEYFIPNDKTHGFKYNFIVRPGANPSVIRVLYHGDVKKLKLENNGEAYLKTKLYDLKETKPIGQYLNGAEIPCRFIQKGDSLAFDFPSGFDKGQTVVIDPFVAQVTTFATNNLAYDVDYDFGGNTFIFGGKGYCKVSMYNLSGILQWTFSGSVLSQAWNSQIGSVNGSVGNFVVDRFLGKAYVGQGANYPRIIRLDASGNYDNFITATHQLYQELWDMGFHCMSGEIFVLGGGHTSNMSSATINTLNASLILSTFQPANLAFVHDISTHIMDDYGNIFVYYACSNAPLNHKIARVNGTFNGNIWTMPSGYTALAEINNKNNYNGGPVQSAGYNGLASSQNYLYYYDGAVLAAYSKATGVPLGSINTGLGPKSVGGVAVDNCDRVYCGAIDAVKTYSFNGTTFSLLSTTSLSTGYNDPRVYDIKLNKNNQTLYISGKEFVKTMIAPYANNCPAPVSVCLFNQAGVAASSTSITCASLGSATVSANGGIGPFSYTWIPSGQTGSVGTNLGPGTYTIIVNDVGALMTYSTLTTFVSPVPLSGSISSSFMLACHGYSNGVAAVVNLTGGSGSQTYLWTDGITTKTTSSISGLSAGNYSLTVTDGLTGCVFSPTFTILEPLPLNSFASASSPTACVGTPIDLGLTIWGGSSAYTFTWSTGSQSPGLQVNHANQGTYTYSALIKDAANCLDTSIISVDFIPYPTLVVSNASICPFETGTISVSGASSYTWNNTSVGSSFTDNPVANQIYTVQGMALSCISTATASIQLKPVPSPVFVSNSPLCQNSPLSMSASTGTAFVWQGVNGYVSTSQGNVLSAAHPSMSGAYHVTVTAANSCTASTQGTITIHPTPSLSATGASACINQTLQLSSSSVPGSNYVWVGANNFVSLLQNPGLSNLSLNTTGNYSVTATSPLGCTNTALVHVSVTPLPVISLSSNSPRCVGSTLSFNTSGTSGASNYVWTGPNGFNSQLANPSLANVSMPYSGTYILEVSTGPCTVTANANAIIHDLPLLMSYNNGPVCEGKTFTVGVSTSETTFLWLGPNGYASTQQTNVFSPAQFNHAGQYTVIVTNTNGCQAADITSVTVLQNPVLNATGDMVCFGQAAQLGVTGADTYYWKGPGSFTATGSNPVVFPTINTLVWTYTVIGTAVNGCTAISSSTIGTMELPIAQMSITPRVCVYSSVQLRGEGGASYHWTGPLAYSSTIKDHTFKVHNMGMGGTYSLMVTDVNGCRNYTTGVLIVDPEPTGQITGDKFFGCVPFCSGYSVVATNASNLMNVQWQIGNQTYNNGNIQHCFTIPGNYELKGNFEDARNCKGSLVQTIEVYPLPEGNFEFSPLKPVENDDWVRFTNTSSGIEQSKWKWVFSDGVDRELYGQQVERLFEEAGVYVTALLVENKWGCLDTVLKTIEVLPDFHVFIPNSFTPNEDGLNDYFFPVMRGVKRFQFEVFDRWGGLIFASSQSDKTWDGSNRGIPCKQDVYTYKLQLLTNQGEEKKYTGSIQLLR